MTSVRTCYCKKEEDVSRKKGNNIGVHNENRYTTTTIVSKRPVIKNETCGSSAESAGRARNITDERMPHTNRSMEAQPPNPVLSPETSTALENAEKIINNAKIQLMEVCAISNLDSARQNRNTQYSDDPPLDDEAEELLYIRELVASKFHQASTSRSDADGKTSARSKESPRVTVRRVDLSAPKFRMSQRRRADWSSLGRPSESDDQLARGRASPAVAPSRDDSSTKDSNEDGNEATARDDRRQASSASERELVRARENACGIQIGPSVHIVDRELTRQDLDDVHISPDPSWTRCRTNTATYTLRHGVTETATSMSNEGNEPEISRAPKTIRGRLDTLQPGKRERSIVAEIAVEDAAQIGNSDSGRDDGRIESAKSQVQDYVRGEERKNRESDPRYVGDTKISEYTGSVTNQGAINSTVIKNSGTGNETLENASKDENQVKVGFRDDTDGRYIEDDKVFNRKSNVDDRARLENEDTADKIQENDQNDRSKRPSAGDTSKKIGFPRRENIASRCSRATESSRPYRTINEHFSGTFNSHNGQDELPDVAGKDVRRSYTSSCSDDFRAEDDSSEVDLYRPRLDDLDTILLSNDKKLERVARATKNFAQLLSKPEFLKYKLDGDKEISRHVNHVEFCQESSVDKDKHEPARSLTSEELRNEDLTVSTVASRRTNANSYGMSANTAETKSSGFATENDCRDNYSKTSVESSVFPASDMSDVSGISRNKDKAQRPRPLSESLMDKSDVTTLSNVVPALSSTRTESYRHREERITPSDRHADAKSRGAQTNVPANKLSAPKPSCDTSEAADRFVTYILQDETRSIEGKVASALKESAIEPTAVQMFLDHLREAESIRNAHQTETLDILKSIFVNVTNQTDQGINKNTKDDKETLRREGTDVSLSGTREENAQQTQAEINAIKQIEKNSHPKSPDEYSSDFSERLEAKENVLSVARSTQNSKDNSKSKRNARETVNADIARDTLVNIKNHTDKGVNGEDAKNDEGIADFFIGTKAPSNAIEEPVLQKEAKDNVSDIGRIARKSYDSKDPDKYPLDSPAFRETRESVRFAARSGSAQSSKNNSKGHSYSEAESLKQISDIHSDDEKNLRHSSIKTASVRSEGGSKTGADDPDATIAISENKGDDVQNNKNDARSDASREAVREITIKKAHNNIANKNASSVISKISPIKDERARSDASSAGLKLAGEIPAKRNVTLVLSSAKEDIESSHVTGKDLVTKKNISSENSRSVDSPRDNRASLSSAKNSKSLKEVASRNKQTSFNIAEDDSAKEARSDEIRASTTLAAIESRRDENENSGLLKSAKSDKQWSNTSQGRRIDILSDSNSSVSSTLLDHDDRSANGAFSLNAKRIGTSSETSHSEGELYMPSSCSYSLGEVRVLKRDLIEDNMIDRDSSVTVFVTRSMLTSLNDSTVSLLGSSEHT